MTHTYTYTIEPRRQGCIAIIYADGWCIVAKQRFSDWDEATAWAQRQVEARKEGAR